MRKTILTLTLIFTLISCDTTFKVEKVLSENRNQKISEVYLVSNFTNSPKVNDSVLKNNFVKKRIQEICKTDINIFEFSAYFYYDIYCTRSFYENYEKYRTSESVIDRCDDYNNEDYAYPYSFTYERLTNDNNLFYWHLVYPERLKDTVYCK